MAESPLDRLKRLAAEKKAAVVPVAQPVVSEVVAEAASGEAGASVLIEDLPNDRRTVLHRPETEAPSNSSLGLSDRSGGTSGTVVESEHSQTHVLRSNTISTQSPSEMESLGNSVTTSESVNVSSHPLAMQFAELESALLASEPEFKTILRQIHKHLGNEPELVTQMSEKEIQMVVQGLIVFANAEIVAPAAAKTQAKKVKEAKAKVISADDL